MSQQDMRSTIRAQRQRGESDDHNAAIHDPRRSRVHQREHIEFEGLRFARQSVLAYVQIICGVWFGFRDRSHAIPLIATAMFFAHDTYYVLNYKYWFALGHPFFVGNLVAMCIFVVFELILIWQIITYSRQEVGLGASKWQACISYAAIQAGVYVMFL
jgi:hypothetical protein